MNYTLLKKIINFSENCLDNFFDNLSQLGLIDSTKVNQIHTLCQLGTFL